MKKLILFVYTISILHRFYSSALLLGLRSMLLLLNFIQNKSPAVHWFTTPMD